MDTYEPNVPDFSAVAIPDELEDLIERLAEVAHDTWAVQRIGQGWSYGPNRDDGLKTNPCLVPYVDLPEEEKAYDRNMARSTIQGILAQGFVIRRG